MACSGLNVLHKYVSKLEIVEQVMVKNESVSRGDKKNWKVYTQGRMKL
jgi:hypothetical protein